MHPILGILILGALLFLVFQAVFSWAAVPMQLIDAGVAQAGAAIEGWLPAGPLRSLLVDGIVAGVGSVLVFLPQILILFLFILVLEDSGYLPRAAYLLDRVMGSVGLSGRAFIPLLSSFACAIPGIMATRVIESPRPNCDDPRGAVHDVLRALAGLRSTDRRVRAGAHDRLRGLQASCCSGSM
jgi:ferrous iron transport protein B